MIANTKKMRQSAACAGAARFLALLPQIPEQAPFAFRGEGGERREELIAETIAKCWVVFVRLVERGVIDAVYATPPPSNASVRHVSGTDPRRGEPRRCRRFQTVAGTGRRASAGQ